MLTPGAMIATDRGWLPVERLQRGDRVVTRESGLRRIVWVGRRDLSYDDLGAVPELCPMLIRKRAFGVHTPTRDMLVSPHQRFPMLQHPGAADERLVAACRLPRDRGAEPASVLGVSYLHLLLETPQAILADGAWVECFHPDDAVQSTLGPHTRAEVLALFPEIATQGAARAGKRREIGLQSRFEQ